MKSKIIFLTAVLTIGITFQHCYPDCECSPIDGPFFDIKGIEVSNKPNESKVDFADYFGFDLVYKVDFVVENSPKNCRWDFSLMNSALACDCEFNGWLGSKSEKLDDITVITLNDFDAEHLANDTITDLMQVWTGEFNQKDLNEYLEQDTALIPSQAFEYGLMLKKAPELNKEFKVKVIVGLSTSETYEVETEPIEIEH
jgi:hypothetical protein